MNSIIRKFVWPLEAVILASTFFLFQVEPFDCEYEQNHPERPDELAFSKPSITWESFDKQDAQEAFVVDPGIHFELLQTVPSIIDAWRTPSSPFQPVRDKSPPSFLT